MTRKGDKNTTIARYAAPFLPGDSHYLLLVRGAKSAVDRRTHAHFRRGWAGVERRLEERRP